jgi:uncharacterized protein (DUF58 family)
MAGRLRRLFRRLRPPRRLRFTRDGRYFVGLAIGIGLAAVNTGNNLLYLLLGWLLSVIVASGILSESTMKKLKVRRRPPPQVFAGRPFLMEISVENKKKFLASYSIEVEDLIDGHPLDKKCYFLKIPPGRTQRTSYRHTFNRRGLHTLDGFRIGTKFPFAFFRKSRDVADEGEILVFPAVHPMPLPAPRARFLGENPVARLGRRGEFFGLREYRGDDDRRAIHWRSSARAGRLLVREFEEEAQRRATILCDNALPAGADAEAELALEKAVSLAASLAAVYVAAGWSVRLICRGAQVPFGVGPPQLLRILKVLALLPTVGPEVGFAGVVEPQGESVLVIPSGVTEVGGRPANCGRVMEAA